jgi:hypothetical protein
LPITIEQLPYDQCAFNITTSLRDVDTSLFRVRANDQLLTQGKSSDYTVTGSVLRLLNKTCRAFSDQDASTITISASYLAPCVNPE